MTSRTYLALIRYIGLLSVPGIWYSADDWWKTQVFAVARGIHLCGTQPVPRHRQLVPVHSANYRGLAKLDHKQDNCTVLGTAACPLAAAADVVAGRWTAAVGVAVMRTCIDCWLWIALSYLWLFLWVSLKAWQATKRKCQTLLCIAYGLGSFHSFQNDVLLCILSILLKELLYIVWGITSVYCRLRLYKWMERILACTWTCFFIWDPGIWATLSSHTLACTSR